MYRATDYSGLHRRIGLRSTAMPQKFGEGGVELGYDIHTNERQSSYWLDALYSLFVVHKKAGL